MTASCRFRRDHSRVQTALEQDDRDTEVDDAEKPLAQGSRLNPTGALRTEQRAAGQQQHDAWQPQLARHRLRHDAEGQRKRDGELWVKKWVHHVAMGWIGLRLQLMVGYSG